DILELVGESGVVGDLERAHPTRLKPLSRPDAPHRGRTDPHPLGHCWRAPVGRLVGRRLVGQRDDPIDGLGWRNARGPGLVAGQPLDSFMHEASCQRHTTVLPLPTARVMAVVPAPSAVRTMIRARQTCFCALLRLRMIVSSRTRSSAVTVMEIPLRITGNRTKPNLQKPLFGFFCQV